MRNRDYIRCDPLDSNILGSLMLPGVPRSLEPLALLYIESTSVPDAVLVSVKQTGLLAAWRNGAIQSIDQRKARAALERLEHIPDQSKVEISEALKTWRKEADMTQARAAQVLGMSKRTYEGIEAGRGFVYPQLLMLALAAFR